MYEETKGGWSEEHLQGPRREKVFKSSVGHSKNGLDLGRRLYNRHVSRDLKYSLTELNRMYTQTYYFTNSQPGILYGDEALSLFFLQPVNVVARDKAIAVTTCDGPQPAPPRAGGGSGPLDVSSSLIFPGLLDVLYLSRVIELGRHARNLFTGGLISVVCLATQVLPMITRALQPLLLPYQLHTQGYAGGR